MKTIKRMITTALMTALLLLLFTFISAALAEGKTVTLRFDVHFYKNWKYSTYDADMYLDSMDGSPIAVLPHGKDASIRVEGVTPGWHEVIFCEHNARSVNGKWGFAVYDSSVLQCTLHAFQTKLTVSDQEKFGLFSPEEMLSASMSPVNTSSCTFRYDIQVDKNGYFSPYDVEMYIDGEYVTTFVQGTRTEGSVRLASAGEHQVTFYMAGRHSSSGSVRLYTAKETTSFKCSLHVTRKKIVIRDIVTNAMER